MRLVPWILCALQASGDSLIGEVPSDPRLRTEWQLVSDQEVFGRNPSFNGPFPSVEPRLPPAIRVNGWRLISRGSDGAARTVSSLVLEPEQDFPEWPAHGEAPLAGAGHAWTTIESDTDEVRMARAPGVEWLMWNGDMFVGDPARRGFGGVPVPIGRGTNRVLAAVLDGKFELEIWKPGSGIGI